MFRNETIEVNQNVNKGKKRQQCERKIESRVIARWLAHMPRRLQRGRNAERTRRASGSAAAVKHRRDTARRLLRMRLLWLHRTGASFCSDSRAASLACDALQNRQNVARRSYRNPYCRGLQAPHPLGHEGQKLSQQICRR